MRSSIFGRTGGEKQEQGGQGGGESGGRQDKGSGGEKINLHKEELDINKKWIKTGDVEIAKEIVEEQKIVEVPVKREEIVIKRTPVNEPSDSEIGKAQVYRIPVGEEKLEVGKRTVVSDEVSVEKREVEETQEVKANLKREEARVRDDGDTKISINGKDAKQQESES